MMFSIQGVNGCTNLHSHKWYKSVLFSSHSLQHWLFVDFVEGREMGQLRDIELKYTKYSVCNR